MKKATSLFLALVMCLSLCACGGIEKSDSSNYIGVWASEHMRFTVEKGGVGIYEIQGSSGRNFYYFTWEVEDDVLVIELYDGEDGGKSTFELNDKGTSLTLLHNSLPTRYTSETVYAKE